MKVDTHVLFIKNDRDEYFEIGVFEEDKLDWFFDELNKEFSITFVKADRIEFSNPITFPITDDNGIIIGTMTHESDLLKI